MFVNVFVINYPGIIKATHSGNPSASTLKSNTFEADNTYARAVRLKQAKDAARARASVH
jgi:hypothetical protein